MSAGQALWFGFGMGFLVGALTVICIVEWGGGL